jgi:hypothetical protein
VGVSRPINTIASAPHRESATNEKMSVASARAAAVSKLDTVILRTQAKAALVGLGWKPAIAGAAVAAAAVEHGADLTLERLIFESLRRCPVPRA